jgi:hypothetical protein
VIAAQPQSIVPSLSAHAVCLRIVAATFSCYATTFLARSEDATNVPWRQVKSQVQEERQVFLLGFAI